MDGKGCWMDNVFIEKLWRSLKYECVYISSLFLLSIWPKTNLTSLCILRVLLIVFSVHDTHPIHTERKDCISEDIKNYSSMRTLPSLVRKAARIQETQIMFHASVSCCSYCG